MVVLFGPENKKNDRSPRLKAKRLGYQIFGEQAKIDDRKNKRK
jgi:hypothetical protein